MSLHDLSVDRASDIPAESLREDRQAGPLGTVVKCEGCIDAEVEDDERGASRLEDKSPEERCFVDCPQ